VVIIILLYLLYINVKLYNIIKLFIVNTIGKLIPILLILYKNNFNVKFNIDDFIFSIFLVIIYIIYINLIIKKSVYNIYKSFMNKYLIYDEKNKKKDTGFLGKLYDDIYEKIYSN